MMSTKESKQKKSQGIEHADAIRELESRLPMTVLETLGIRIDSYDPVVVVTEVDQRLYQPTGVVHGGVFVLMAETAASVAAGLSIDMSKYVPLGMEINANHLRSVNSGTLRAIASPLHQGRSSHVYQIELRDDQERLVCVSRCTVAIRAIDQVKMP